MATPIDWTSAETLEECVVRVFVTSPKGPEDLDDRRCLEKFFGKKRITEILARHNALEHEPKQMEFGFLERSVSKHSFQ